MKLPVPLHYGGNIFNDCEIRKPTPQILVDASKDRDERSVYHALLTIIKGGIVSLTDKEGKIIEDKKQIASMCRWMPYKSAEYIAIQMMTLHYKGEDGIEGVYVCPRCGYKIISEVKREDEQIIFDTRDFLKNLEVKYLENGTQSFDFYFSECNTLKYKVGNEDREEVIENVELKYPCLQHLINADAKIGRNNAMEPRDKLLLFL